MNLSINGTAEEMINQRLRSGQYTSAEDVISAALGALESVERSVSFAPGELDRLIDEGFSSGPPLDGETVLEELRNLRHSHKQNS